MDDQSNDRLDEEVLEFWTPERMRAAKPLSLLDLPPPQSHQFRSLAVINYDGTSTVNSLTETSSSDPWKFIPSSDEQHYLDAVRARTSGKLEGSSLSFQPPFARRKVPDVHVYPYNAIGRFYYEQDGEHRCGTGAIVASNVILTNARCVWDRKNGRFSRNMAFRPCYPDSLDVFYSAGETLIFIPDEWQKYLKDEKLVKEQRLDWHYDVALVCVRGNMLRKYQKLYLPVNSQCVAGPYRSIGYPKSYSTGGPFDGDHMWECIGAEVSGHGLLLMRSDMYENAVGSPWLAANDEDQAQRCIVGLTNAGTPAFHVGEPKPGPVCGSPRFPDSLASSYERAASFTTTWESELPNGGKGIVSVLADSDGRLHAGSNGYVYRLDQATGAVLAQNHFPRRGSYEVRLAAGNNTLFLGIRGHVISVNPDDLGENWEVFLARSMAGTVSVHTVHTVDETHLYAGVDGRVYKLDKHGAEEAQNLLSEDTSLWSSIEVRFASGDSGFPYLYAGCNGWVWCLNAKTLKSIWAKQVGVFHVGFVEVLLRGDSLYAGSMGRVYKLNRKQGAEDASNSLSGLGYHEVRMATDGNYLYVGTNSHGIALSLDDLKTAWQLKLPGGSNIVSVLCQEGRVFFGSGGYAYQVDLGGNLLSQNTMDGESGEVRLAAVQPRRDRILTPKALPGVVVDPQHDKPEVRAPSPLLPSAGRLRLFVGTRGGVYGISANTKVEV
ncbi:MAG TPA: PQQ-binding-like beta-propeller repeat protein [Candidatus Binatia bacterium]|nr:PQQ-binding-like beta-propeller repeat protein [Candidatus Binatia bacterium]